MTSDSARPTRHRSIAELTQPDPLTARFSPNGLLTQGVMRPEGSVEYLQAMVDEAGLGSTVAEDVRRSFERARMLHVYGLFQYGFFTLADEAAWLLPESALGVRFIERYGGRVPFLKDGERSTLETSVFRTVAEAVSPRGQFSRRAGWSLEGHADYGEGRSFDGSYRALMQWARREGLLTRWLAHLWARNEEGIRYAVLTRVRPPDYAVPEAWGDFDEDARSAWWETWRRDIWERDQMNVLVELRNLIAHSSPGRVVTPVDSARSLFAVAEFVKHLWA